MGFWVGISVQLHPGFQFGLDPNGSLNLFQVSVLYVLFNHLANLGEGLTLDDAAAQGCTVL